MPAIRSFGYLVCFCTSLQFLGFSDLVMAASEEEIRRRHPSAASKASSSESWSSSGSGRKLSFAQKRQQESAKGWVHRLIFNNAVIRQSIILEYI